MEQSGKQFPVEDDAVYSRARLKRIYRDPEGGCAEEISIVAMDTHAGVSRA
jgi:hypothetical protein